MKSLNIDIILPWELGLIIVIIGIISVILGIKQSKFQEDDLDKIPIFKATTKIFFGSIALILGLIQMLPLIKYI